MDNTDPNNPDAVTTFTARSDDGHKSDCALHNEPAMPAGPCDCWTEAKQEAEKVWPACEFCRRGHNPSMICRAQIESEWQAVNLAKLTNPILPDPKRENRIESLRAASRIVAGLYNAIAHDSMEFTPDDTPEGLTTRLAKQFEKYLEGE